MATSKGTKHNIGMTHREVLSWTRSAKPGEDLRAAKGLYLRKTQDGAFWTYRYLSPVTGRQMRVPLWGDDDGAVVGFPEATLDEATGRAAYIRSQVAAGVDPVLAAQEEAQAALAAAIEARRVADVEQGRRVTVRQLFDRWATTELAPHTRADGTRTGRKDGGDYLRKLFELHAFPELGHMQAHEVRKSDVLPKLDSLRAAGKLRTANVLLAGLKQMFRFALTREIVERNPLDVVTKRDAGGVEVPRDRVLDIHEIKSLPRAIEAARMGERSQCAIWIILATGCRIGELLGAVWADADKLLPELTSVADASGVKVGIVDLKAGTWHLPTTKNERDHTIHLSAFAMAQFERLQALREAAPELDRADGPPVVCTAAGLTPWVFPNTAVVGPVCIGSFGKQLADRQRPPERRLPGRSKKTSSLVLPGGRWTAHDLRRTTGTLMAQLGISGDVIDECLNHIIESRVRRTYIRDRREADQVRAFDALGSHLARLVSDAPAASNVVALPSAA